MQEERAPWLDDEDEPQGSVWAGRNRLRLLVAAATLPWLVVIAVMLSPLWRGGGQAPVPPGAVDQSGWPIEQPAPGEHRPAPGTTPDGQSGPAAPGLPQESDPSPGEVLGLTELRGDWRLGPEVGDLGAVAMLVARGWLSGIGPALRVDGVDPVGGAYLEQVVVEAVERPAAGAAVVSLAVVVLEEAGDGLAARARRLAVPLSVGPDHVRPAGQPWWLPGHDLAPVALATAPVDDHGALLAAAEAVSAAGYRDVEVVSLEQSDLWPWIARVDATTPDGLRVSGPVWLRRHLDGFVVAGTPPPATHPAGPGEVLP